MCVPLPVRMEQLGSHWTDFHDIWYLIIFLIFIDKIQISLKSDKNNGHFTRRPACIYGSLAKILEL
jgi:hypothetical protein